MPNKIIIKSDEYQLNLPTEDSIIVERQLVGHTKRDIEIESLAIPQHPLWLYITIRSIRFYQIHISKKLGNRCVFDPSCSHYSEMAFRQKGFIKGLYLTIKRLYRCRPGNGGIDELI